MVRHGHEHSETGMTEILKPAQRSLRDPSKVTEIRRAVRTLWDCGGEGVSETRNPAPNPVSIERVHLPRLADEPYVVSEKSDGVRYLLLLGRYEGTRTAYSVMVDRTMTPYEVQVCAAERYFDGSLFDGELVWEHGTGSAQPRQMYLVFDLIGLAGEDWRHRTYVQRIERIGTLFHSEEDDLNFSPDDWTDKAKEYATAGKIMCTGNAFCLGFRPKPCMAAENLDIIWRNRHRLRHRSDGLLFTPVECPVVTGTHERAFKWKQNHTIDLLLRCRLASQRSPPFEATRRFGAWDVDLLFVDEGGRLTSACAGRLMCRDAHACCCLERNDVLDSMLAHCERKGTKAFDCVVECACIIQSSDAEPRSYVVRCLVEKLRRDKLTPNNRRTVERTLVNIDEAITVNELLAVVNPRYHGPPLV